jgi:SAM-dependent methyltransferase
MTRTTISYWIAAILLGTGCTMTTEHAHPEGHAHAHDHAHGPLVHRFEHAEDWAKEFDDPARDAWQHPKEVVDALGITPGMTVADVGAGTGYFEPWLSKAVGPTGLALALDVEPDMTRYLSERARREGLGNVRAMLVPLDVPRLPDASTDRILVVDTWHHIVSREAYSAKLRRSLKPGGKVFVVDFTLEAKHGPPAHHRVSADAVAAELSSAGLSCSIAPVGLPEQYVVVGSLP